VSVVSCVVFILVHHYFTAVSVVVIVHSEQKLIVIWSSANMDITVNAGD